MRINRKKTQFVKSVWCEGDQINIDGTPLTETTSYVYPGRSMNIDSDVKEELLRRSKAAWSAYESVKEATDQLSDPDLDAHLFDSIVLPAHCCASETWGGIASTSKSLLTTHRALQRCLLKSSWLSKHRAGLHSSDLRTMSRLTDPEEYTSKMKHRWASHTQITHESCSTKLHLIKVEKISTYLLCPT
ncbi:unnamed protein product [Heligmosomoides polygyrus]|uniref:Aldedh domain-containing protein n=1 Tax=Heligmosomoides polygyrus TaxID=6339 RepID=A0A183G915_HELPZ|nr:unnamed protein product [Heligmosomoides polygyrus]